MAAVVLDTHALTEWAARRPSTRLLAALEAAVQHEARVLVPTAVLVEALTGRPADAAVRHRVNRAEAVDLTLPLAAEAATRRQRWPNASVVDAVVAATAATMGAAAVLTSDPDDLTGLLAGDAVHVVTV
ncbi:hypothetical protein BH23ACT9_BH23ACT9_06160 [soil metagenome]